ncbi:zinc/manganese transport system substrate-binding protein [Amycolatopsis arida]|uniref:Zinc/manganese transport system substrate-binding protein n=1 Tax=Amycolatopsis arida TaxID=587909 RepID=A0A1I5R427_9PSEU|nr:zinc ABC transporter substrate-binding protein [Amycolatopsis arida]TDX99070.1 zinc/manganese transport system substrate-binding protein [Amycolatopsis arida]SFP53249.1 zinc/manganese transport system substrate-binding protein [Amycolatopsis arida]
MTVPMTAPAPRRARRLLSIPPAVAVLALGLTACGGDTGSGGDQAADGTVPVVVSTSVWGSVVSAVAGDAATVTSIINDPSGDPHSYQATARDAATVQGAKLLVSNGGGYDDFFTKLADQAPDTRKVVAVELAPADEQGHAEGGHADEGPAEGGHGHGHEGRNEHVWYDVATVRAVADRVAAELGELRPEDEQRFTDNAAAFSGRLDELEARIDRMAAEHAGTKVVATEPVAHYLLEAARLDDVTPRDFAEAIEEETDVPVAAQEAVNQLVEGRQVRVVVHNEQTETPVTEQLVAKAGAAGIPVVTVTETLPEGQTDYIAWMSKQVDELAAALSGA